MSLEGGENPFKVVRHQNGLSMRKAARKIGCNFQLIYMTEHGMYWRMPDVLLDWAVDNSDYTRYQLQDAFCVFQIRQRKVATEEFSLGSISIEALGKPGENPIVKFRQSLGLTQSAFCKKLCIPVAILYIAEHQTSLPDVLRESFLELSIPLTVVEEMEARFEIVQ